MIGTLSFSPVFCIIYWRESYCMKHDGHVSDIASAFFMTSMSFIRARAVASSGSSAVLRLPPQHNILVSYSMLLAPIASIRASNFLGLLGSSKNMDELGRSI